MSAIIYKPLLGADIEVFVAERETNRIISAEPFIKGTKKEPFIFDATNPHFAISLDNILAEFGIPPAATKEEFYNNIQKSLGYINSILPKEYCTVAIPAANLEKQFLKTKQAKTFGCEPDFNAYTGQENIRPYADDSTLRSCGGHLHTSWVNPAWFNKEEGMYDGTNDTIRRLLIRMYDLYIGVPSVLQEPDNKRKELYGKAGAYRPKEYGVEYRTLSNYYLQSKQLTDWVYNSAHSAIEAINSGFILPEAMYEVVINTINFNNKEMATELVKEYQLKLAS